MEQYKGKVAVVTGASSGIGAAVAKTLLQNGMKVVGLARRKEKIEQICNDHHHLKKNLFALKVDITNETEVIDAFKWITEHVGPVVVLVNNAGLSKSAPIVSGDSKSWKAIIDTNVMGAAFAAREAIAVMKKHDVRNGYIINVNSVGGHQVFNMPGMGMSFYQASKFALTALTQALRYELIQDSNKIRVCSLSPGLVDTEMIRIGINGEENAKKFLEENPYLIGDDIADAVKFLLNTRAMVEITELTIRPVGERF